MIAFFFFYFYPNQFSERLTYAMEKQKIDAKSLASQMNVSPKTVHRWLNGEYEPRHINLPKAARVLNVSTDYLCGIEN